MSINSLDNQTDNEKCAVNNETTCHGNFCRSYPVYCRQTTDENNKKRMVCVHGITKMRHTRVRRSVGRVLKIGLLFLFSLSFPYSSFFFFFQFFSMHKSFFQRTVSEDSSRTSNLPQKISNLVVLTLSSYSYGGI